MAFKQYSRWKIIFLDTDDGCAFDVDQKFRSLHSALDYVAKELLDMIRQTHPIWEFKTGHRLGNFYTLPILRACFKYAPDELKLIFHERDSNMVRTVQADTMNWIIIPIEK